jgi:hypothetical protein
VVTLKQLAWEEGHKCRVTYRRLATGDQVESVDLAPNSH